MKPLSPCRPMGGVAPRRLSLMGLLVTLGVVYGDIGTSPLYVMRAVVGAAPTVTPSYVVGAVSCVIWTLTLQTTLKYVVLALRADNHGEGGILALYALVRRLGPSWLYLVAIAGASALVADGVITPSITVLSAVEGLRTVAPSTPVVPIALTILAALFVVQQFGAAAIGRLFGPVMLAWFAMLGAVGAAHIGDHWAILEALNRWCAVRLLATSPQWFLVLGAVFLCTTGAEALYSDMGHCGRANIRVSWVWVKAMLVLNYLGQGAWLIAHADGLHPGVNPFFAVMPAALLPVGVVLATMAAVVASQALISGSFTIFSEAMSLRLWPRQRVKHPTDVRGQLYIPFVNGSLFALCVGVVLLFGSSAAMEAAYGLAITVTMLMTTLLLAVHLRQRGGRRAVVWPAAAAMAGVECVFLVANLAKFAHGGWLTMLLAGVLAAVMYVWHGAHRIRSAYVQRVRLADYYQVISDIKADRTIRKFATNVVYLSKLPGTREVEQKVLYSIIHKRPMRADHYLLLHIDYTDQPSTLRYDFHELVAGTLYKVNLHLGFRVQPLVNVYLRQVIEDQVRRGRFSLANGFPSLRRHGVPGNFVFMLIERVCADINMLPPRQRAIMQAYSALRHIRLGVTAAMGLDTSNVMAERVPMAVKPRTAARRVTGG